MKCRLSVNSKEKRGVELKCFKFKTRNLEILTLLIWILRYEQINIEKQEFWSCPFYFMSWPTTIDKQIFLFFYHIFYLIVKIKSWSNPFLLTQHYFSWSPFGKGFVINNFAVLWNSRFDSMLWAASASVDYFLALPYEL